jgi:hypothetical protein
LPSCHQKSELALIRSGIEGNIKGEAGSDKGILEWNEGNHFKDPDIRTAKGFA